MIAGMDTNAQSHPALNCPMWLVPCPTSEDCSASPGCPSFALAITLHMYIVILIKMTIIIKQYGVQNVTLPCYGCPSSSWSPCTLGTPCLILINSFVMDSVPYLVTFLVRDTIPHPYHFPCYVFSLLSWSLFLFRTPSQLFIFISCLVWDFLTVVILNVTDPDPFDTDPAFHFGTDPDPGQAFLFATDPNPAGWFGSGSGSLPFQRDNVPKWYFLYIFPSFPCQ